MLSPEHAHQAHHDAERRYRELFERTSDIMVVYRIEPDGRVICEDFNPAAELATGFERAKVIGKEPRDIVEASTALRLARRYRDAITTRAPVTYEEQFELPTGLRTISTTLLPALDDTGRVFRLTVISRDVTALRAAEAMQRQLEDRFTDTKRHDALTTLTGHIAHDVNNLLAVITSLASRLGDEPTNRAQDAITQATRRGRQLTQRLLSFGRQASEERKPIDLVPLVRETRDLLEPTAPEVTFLERISPKLPKVLADAAQLHQVLINLASNALHAMPEHGTLTLGLEPAQGRPARQWVRLWVQDTGPGMPEAIRRRLLSQEERGAAPSVGLEVVQALVKANGGTVAVTVEGGTTVSVFLPAMSEEADKPGAGQRLMLVDDHPGMARVSAKLLETLGYRASIFEDPREALAAFEADPQAFDAVLTDLSMPQMSGEDLTLAILRIRPSMPVIITSGLGTTVDVDALYRLGARALLVKPWRLEEAVSTLQRVLKQTKAEVTPLAR